MQGQEDHALEKRVEGKKAAAKKRAARKGRSDRIIPNSSVAKLLFFLGTRSKKAAPAPAEDDMYDE